MEGLRALDGDRANTSDFARRWGVVAVSRRFICSATTWPHDLLPPFPAQIRICCVEPTRRQPQAAVRGRAPPNEAREGGDGERHCHGARWGAWSQPCHVRHTCAIWLFTAQHTHMTNGLGICPISIAKQQSAIFDAMLIHEKLTLEPKEERRQKKQNGEGPLRKRACSLG